MSATSTPTAHSTWCDPRQHASDDCGSGEICASAAITVGRFGGWLTATGSGEAKIVLDKPGHRLDGDYTEAQARQLLAEQLELAAFLTKAIEQLERSA